MDVVTRGVTHMTKRTLLALLSLLVLFDLPTSAASQLVATSTASADLRTAAATEHLSTATWWLVGVGVATLLAALGGAIAAVRAYMLESTPAVVITGRREGLPATGPLEAGYSVTRDHDEYKPTTLTVSTKAPRVIVTPLFVDPRTRDIARQVAVEVQNLGRMPVVEANLYLRFTVPEIIGFAEGSTQTIQREYFGSVRVKAIAANSKIILPLVNEIGAFKLDVVGVTGMSPAKAGRKARSRQLPFISSTVLIPPP